MSSRLADRLKVARRRRFVGRSSELDLFRSALTAPELPFSVLHVFGPGGVGKTTLMTEFEAIAEEAGIPAVRIDARNVEAAPEAFVGSLQRALGLDPSASLFEALDSGGRLVILIDTYELLASLDDWLRDVFLPELPGETLIVLAGRAPPAEGWRTDPGWQMLLHTISLRNLSPDEGRRYLSQQAIPTDQHQALLTFTHGHPLALSLVADVFAQRGDTGFEPQATPDVIKVLLERLVRKVPGPAHRAALEACALVRLTTETLLAEMLKMPDAHELFEWMRGLSFVESGPRGLFPHDLAREALIADLRWRNPDWYAELHRRARDSYVQRLQRTQGLEQQRVLYDYIYLHRDNPVVRPFFEWQGSGGALTDILRPGDEEALVEMVAQHEGETSARLAAQWIERQPAGVVIFRDAPGGPGQIGVPSGFLSMVALNEVSEEERNGDPGLQGPWRYLRSHAPLRAGERATVFRFWMARDSYQAISPIQTLIFVHMVRHYLVTPGLAFTFIPCVEPDFWTAVFAYGDLQRLPEADFEVDGRRFGVYGHDWRAVPPMAWLALLAERETASGAVEPTPPKPSEQLLVLSQADFNAAVRDALRDLLQPEVLRGNPLLRSRLLLDVARGQDSARERASTLQALIKETIESLQKLPQQAKLYRVLYHTYVQPAPTQEQAAELLDLPFSTYRRHLKAGIEQVAERLWEQEVGAHEK